MSHGTHIGGVQYQIMTIDHPWELIERKFMGEIININIVFKIIICWTLLNIYAEH